MNTNRFGFINKSIVLLFLGAMLFSCQDSLEQVQRLDKKHRFAKGVAQDFRLVHTDSARVKVILSSPKMLDYSNQDFSYTEFPNGMQVEVFDADNNKSIITANHAVYYNTTDIIDLQGDVTIKTHDGRVLKAPQLYWDQKNEWVFTEKNYTFTSPDISMSGIGIDFNKQFTQVISHKNSGNYSVKE